MEARSLSVNVQFCGFYELSNDLFSQKMRTKKNLIYFRLYKFSYNIKLNYTLNLEDMQSINTINEK